MPLTPIEETLRFLDDAVSSGKIGYYGFFQLPRLAHRQGGRNAKARGYTPAGDAAAAIQPACPRYRAGDRSACQMRGWAFCHGRLLGGGWLTGKYRRDQMPTGATRLGESEARHGSYDQRNAQERTWDIIGAGGNREVQGLQHGASGARLIAARPAVTSVIPAPARRSNWRTTSVRPRSAFPTSEMSRLTEISAPHPFDYPYGVGGTNQRHRKLEGGRYQQQCVYRRRLVLQIRTPVASSNRCSCAGSMVTPIVSPPRAVPLPVSTIVSSRRRRRNEGGRTGGSDDVDGNVERPPPCRGDADTCS